MTAAKSMRSSDKDREFTYEEYLSEFKSKPITEEEPLQDDAEEVGASMAERSLAILRDALSAK